MDDIPLREKEQKPLTEVPQFELHVHGRAIKISEGQLKYQNLIHTVASYFASVRFLSFIVELVNNVEYLLKK
jgi:hypothetical protein